MISSSFITYWSAKYSFYDYPETFYKNRLSILQGENIENEIFREAIIALLHWKDKKANNYNPDNFTAKENTLSVIPGLNEKDLSDFKNQFISFRKSRHVFDKGKQFWSWLTHDKKYWNSIVIPIFVCHCSRPIDIPIVDQHVVRTMNLFKGNFQEINKKCDDWSVYEEYYDFYHSICVDNSLSTFEQLRMLDKALWSFGKNIKKLFEKDKDVSSVNTKSSIPNRGEQNGVQKIGKLTKVFSPHLDEVFAKRCYYHFSRGIKQEEAIKQACNEFGINFNSLPDMYSKYAGRGFNEWRNKSWIP